MGRLTGGLLLLQLLAIMAGFILLRPGVTTNFLSESAAQGGQTRAAVLILMFGAAVTVAMGVTMYGYLRRFTTAGAVLLAIVTTLWAAGQLADNANIMSMLSLSERFAESTNADPVVFGHLAAQVRSTRLWYHYTELLVMDVWFAVFYGLLFAYRLVPRWLAAVFGLLMVALHLIGLPIAMYAGYPLITEIAYGLLGAYLAIGGWLVVRGFPLKAQQSGS